MKKKLAGLGLILVLLMSTVSFVSASSGGYTTQRFDVDVTVGEDHVIHVEETIKVNFTEARHGIYRYIPYETGIYKITNLEAEGDPYETYDEGEMVLRIGDADETIKGKHTYHISYDMVCYEDQSADVDYFSLDVIPPEWDTDIDASKITVTFPKAVDPDAMKIYSGVYGFEGNDGGITATFSKDNTVMSIEAEDLIRYQAITLSSELPEGYWVGEANHDWMIWPILILLIGVPLLMFLLWLAFGRDPKVVKTVEFYPPEGMTPLEVGYLVDGNIDQKDISSMIIYYAEKGYLSIHEYDKNEYELIKACNIAETEEKSFSKRLFNGLFAKGDTVRMDALPDDFGDYIILTKEKLERYYSKEKRLFKLGSRVCRVLGTLMLMVMPVALIVLGAAMAFDYVYGLVALPSLILMIGGLGCATSVFDKWNSRSKGKRGAMIVLAVILLALSAFVTMAVIAATTASIIATILVPISMVVTMIFVVLMNARTKKSAEWLGKILGFRDFIEAAELEKLKLMVEENPSYFYNIIPYAYVFGLSDKWAKKFELIESPAPRWYVGYGRVDAWDVYWYSRMCNRCLNSFSHQFNAAAVAAASEDFGGGSIGGGFGGGGFSGGGFGGGGGGSW